MKGNTNEKFVAVMASPFQSLEGMLQQLLTERSIDTAVGAQLDVIGRIVGQRRNGLDDDTYRRHCRAKISVNRATGTFEDIYKIIDLIIYDDDAEYVAQNEGTATVRVRVDDLVITPELAKVTYGFLRKAVSAGVRLIFEWGEVPEDELFTLDIGPGFVQGRLSGTTLD